MLDVENGGAMFIVNLLFERMKEIKDLMMVKINRRIYGKMHARGLACSNKTRIRRHGAYQKNLSNPFSQAYKILYYSSN